jgi:hypothetical protein
MKMDRNTNPDGSGKYALLNMRKLKQKQTLNRKDFDLQRRIDAALATLREIGVLEMGNVGTETEFFPIKLKDVHSHAALIAYANHAAIEQPEFAKDVLEMATRAGVNNPWCKLPD